LARLLWIRRQLSQRDRWTRDELLAHQRNELGVLRAHAYATSPFYQRFHSGLADKPLQELPVLTKKVLMENWDELVTDRGIRLNELRAFVERLDVPLLFRNEYVVSTTSGSTGLKGVFAFNRDEWLWGVASHGRATAWAGARIGPLHRLRMAVVSSTKPWCKSLLVGASVDTAILPTLRLDSTEPLHTIVERLNAFRPDVLVAYAETANALALAQLAGELRIAPRMVFASSEVFTESARERVGKAWGREPFNAYAATETALIAADCAHHRLHLAEDLIIAEVVDRDNRPVPLGSYGEKVLVTVLFARTVPLIRYELSDRVAFADMAAPCACGKPFAVLAGIQGRVEDTVFLEGAGGAPIAIKPDIFHDVLEPAPVDGWQVVQEAATGITVSIVGPQVGYDELDLTEKIRSRLQAQGAHDPVVQIRVIDKLQQSLTGKTPLVQALKQS
jgi:phenylacetate-coenzyme A ligase PaaK-like adenylate-forming protein